MYVHQMDVQTAFLNGKVLEEVSVKQPLGYEHGTFEEYKLFKSVYDLKESPRTCYECFNIFVRTKVFKGKNVTIVFMSKCILFCICRRLIDCLPR